MFGAHAFRYKRVFLKLCFLTCILTSFLPVASWYLPFSKLYSKFHNADKLLNSANRLNEYRVHSAVTYFNNIDRAESKLFYENQAKYNLDLVICIVTQGRRLHQDKNRGYLLQTAAETDKVVKKDHYFLRKVLIVCNVDENPNLHTDFEFVKNYFPYVQKYGDSDLPRNVSVPFLDRTKYSISVLGEIKKETMDYIFCMNVSYSLNSTFVLMLEDDVIPHSNVFKLLNFTVDRQFLHSGHSYVKSSRNYAYLKLYYPEKWQGYANEVHKITELLCTCSVGAGLFLVIMFIIQVLCLKQKLSDSTQWIYFLYGFISTLIVVSLIGRQNVIELRRLSPYLFNFGPAKGCCVPAVFYPRTILPPFMIYLTNSTGQKDLEMNKFLTDYNIPGYQLEPNLFYHTGMYSSRYEGHKNPEEYIFLN